MASNYYSTKSGPEVDAAVTLVNDELITPAAARSYLELGDAASKDVGTASGDVAAGDDSRISGAAQKSANLTDLASASSARTALGLGTAAVKTAGAANGVADLDSGGKVPSAQLPATVVGGLHYVGTWNATTNSPTLVSSTGTTGDYYVVSVAGTTTIDGESDWDVKDWITFNGTVWEKIDNTEKDATGSVNGNVRLTTDLGGTAASPQVVGLGASALPSNAANGFLKRNSGNTAWEEVAYGSGSNTVAQGNDARLSDSRAPSGSASGDLSSTYPGPTVAKINGVALGTTTATDKNILIANGTNWVTQAITGDITLSNAGVVALLGTVAVLSPDFATLTDASTVTWATGGLRNNNAKVTITASRTLSITGAVAGASGVLKVTQGGSGSYALTLPAGSKVANGGSGAVTLSTAVGAIDILGWYYDGTNYFWTIGLNFT